MSDLATNRRAFHDYEILETHEAGIVLQGTEVKSLRTHGASLQEAYIILQGEELWLINASIAPYTFGNIYNHEERRKRKLLMHRKEITRLEKEVKEKGVALIPLAFYLKKGRIKLKFGVGKGKKLYDKRKSLQEREVKKHIKRAVKGEY